jgi:hypothetical protein
VNAAVAEEDVEVRTPDGVADAVLYRDSQAAHPGGGGACIREARQAAARDGAVSRRPQSRAPGGC